MPEQDMKDDFVDGLLPIYKLFIIDNHAMNLGDMIDLMVKKEPCINKICAMKKFDHASFPKLIYEDPHKVEENHITHK